MELVKLFDCQDMPQNVRDSFFKDSGSPSFRGGNDCVVEWMLWGKTSGKKVACKKPYAMKNIHGMELPYAELTDAEIFDEWGDDGDRYVIQRGDCIVSDWLKDNGADNHEDVLIKHWW